MRFQFSLRSIMIAVALAACLCAAGPLIKRWFPPDESIGGCRLGPPIPPEKQQPIGIGY